MLLKVNGYPVVNGVCRACGSGITIKGDAIPCICDKYKSTRYSKERQRSELNDILKANEVGK